MKKQFKDYGYIEKIEVNDDVSLKQCFDKAVAQYMQTEEAKEQLEKVFQDWPPAIISKNVKILIFLISHAPTALDILINHVYEDIKNENPSLTTLYLAEHLMLADGYNGELDYELNCLTNKNSNPYIYLLGRLLAPASDQTYSYINIEDQFLNRNRSIMQQVRRTILADRHDVYSLAYSHLLNTFQEWCFLNKKAPKKRNQYNRNDVVKWLEHIASHSEIVFVIKMFERRHRNTISHPGDESAEVNPVNETEYKEDLKTLNHYLSNFRRKLS